MYIVLFFLLFSSPLPPPQKKKKVNCSRTEMTTIYGKGKQINSGTILWERGFILLHII